MAQHTISSADGQDKPSGASTVLNGRYMPPPADDDGKRWMRTSAIILKSRDELYNLWRDVESSVQWRGQTVDVRETGPGTFHWVMKNGDLCRRSNPSSNSREETEDDDSVHQIGEIHKSIH